jgi:hypothetical protein
MERKKKENTNLENYYWVYIYKKKKKKVCVLNKKNEKKGPYNSTTIKKRFKQRNLVYFTVCIYNKPYCTALI